MLAPPDVAAVQRGVRLASLAKALSAVRFPMFANDNWFVAGPPAKHYLHNGCGDCVWIAWNAHGLVALAFAHEDGRNTFNDPSPPDPWRLLAGLPPALLPLARARMARLPTHPYAPRVPLLTTAFWSTGGPVVGAEPWPSVLAHAQGVFERYLLAPALAMGGGRHPWNGHDVQGWAELNDLDPDQAVLCLTLLDRRGVLALDEAVIVLRDATKESVPLVRQKLAALGLRLPRRERCVGPRPDC